MPSVSCVSLLLFSKVMILRFLPPAPLAIHKDYIFTIMGGSESTQSSGYCSSGTSPAELRCPVQHSRTNTPSVVNGAAVEPEQPQPSCPVDHSGQDVNSCPVKPSERRGFLNAWKSSAASAKTTASPTAYNVYNEPIDPNSKMPLNLNQFPAVGCTSSPTL